jgi:peroxidase
LKKIIRSIDGSGNNLANPKWGSTKTRLLRKSFADYVDGLSKVNNNKVSPRVISNKIGCLTPNKPIDDPHKLNILFTIFGQFIDHDITLSLTGN